MARRTDQLIGQVIGGRYQVIEPLAKGGMGSVLIGTQIDLNRKVAIKVVHQVIRDEGLLKRFRREAEAMATVSHPAIVEIYDFIEEEEGQYLVMAYVEGQDLRQYLDEKPNQIIVADEAVELMAPIASALTELHTASILHRDIKPANIIRYLRADRRPAVKLVDFGIARKLDDLGLTSDGHVVGTPQYLSPEVLLGKKHSPTSDIYALGVTLFELLTGIRPFDGDDLHSIIKKSVSEPLPLPPELVGRPLGDLLSKMLKKDETLRPDALTVLRELERLKLPGRPYPEPRSDAPTVEAPHHGARSPAPSAGPAPVTAGTRSVRAVHLVLAAGLAAIMGVSGTVLFFRPWKKEKGKKPTVTAAADRSRNTPEPRTEPARTALDGSAPAPRPAARRGKPRPDAGAVPAKIPKRLPSIFRLSLGCKTPAEGKALYDKGVAVQRQGETEYARRIFHAVIRSRCAQKAQRMYAAHRLALVYINRNHCKAARTVWTIYQKLAKSRQPLPGCN